jgi:hypothetical protein
VYVRGVISLVMCKSPAQSKAKCACRGPVGGAHHEMTPFVRLLLVGYQNVLVKVSGSTFFS